MMGPMSALLLPLEIAGFTAALCLLHGLKPRLGLAPLYVAVGLLEAFLFVSGKVGPDGARITVEVFGTADAHLSYLLFLPLLLGSVVLVYVLEGTAEARRLVIGIVCIYLLHGLFDVVIDWHAANPAPGQPALAHDTLTYYSVPSRLASLGAFCVDAIVILVTYQFLINRGPRLPLVIPVFLSLVVAMVVDGFVYELLRGRLLHTEALRMVEKLQAGIAAGLPLSLYLGAQLRRHQKEVRRGILERGAFSILDLRRRVLEVEALLREEKQAYQQVRDTFGRYVSSEVVDSLLSDPSRLELGGELREVTVLFADIRGYSTLAESLAPTAVIGMLNRYFELVTNVILAERGMINEFEGDGVLAVFGAPNALPDHSLRAVRAGLGMLDAVARLNAEWTQDGTVEQWRACGVDGLRIRVGIHSGPVVAGNVGSEARTKYAVIGDTVNIAARVESLNKELGTDLLVTATTQAAIEAGETQGATEAGGTAVRFSFLGEHAVKGRQEPVAVYEVAGRRV